MPLASPNGREFPGNSAMSRANCSTASRLAQRLKAATDTPVLMGLGVSTPEQAREVAADADGVIVGSALVRRLLDGASPEEAGAFVTSLRSGLTGR